MNAYRVKEILWVVIILLYCILFLLLGGCSSTPPVQAQKPQYCHTSQTIQTQNGQKVESKTTVECTDDQVTRLTAKRIGLASNCGEFTYWTQIGGRDVQRKGISCQKPDGRWEVINTTN